MPSTPAPSQDASRGDLDPRDSTTDAELEARERVVMVRVAELERHMRNPAVQRALGRSRRDGNPAPRRLTELMDELAAQKLDLDDLRELRGIRQVRPVGSMLSRMG